MENANEEIETIHGPLDICTEPFSLEEYRIAKISIKEGKACGEDKVAQEVSKRCDIDSIVLHFCNRALTRGEKPDHWSISNIIPFHKKGDLSDPKNYKGISLSSLNAKTLNKMILNRLKPAIEGILRRNQNGFRPGRSTVQQIPVLRRIIEGVKGRKLPAVEKKISRKRTTVQETKYMAVWHVMVIQGADDEQCCHNSAATTVLEQQCCTLMLHNSAATTVLHINAAQQCCHNSAAATVLSQQCCHNSAATTVLHNSAAQQCCNNSAATSVLEQQCCTTVLPKQRCTTVLPQQCWNNSAATTVLPQQCWNNSAATKMLHNSAATTVLHINAAQQCCRNSAFTTVLSQ